MRLRRVLVAIAVLAVGLAASHPAAGGGYIEGCVS